MTIASLPVHCLHSDILARLLPFALNERVIVGIWKCPSVFQFFVSPALMAV
ncbi:hypothetical protein ACXXDI_04960 [Deinococcus sp. PESE-13]